MALATLSNGAIFWMRRVGWIDPEIKAEFEEKIGPDIVAVGMIDDSGLQNRYEEEENAKQTVVNPEKVRIFYALRSVLYRHEGSLILLKLAKDFFLFVFLGCYVCMGFRIGRQKKMPDSYLLMGFSGIVCASLLLSVRAYGVYMPLLGLRGFSFLLVVMACYKTCRVEDMRALAITAIGILLFQMVLLPIEMQRCIKLFSGNFWGIHNICDRVVGSFLIPASLGIFSVLAFNLYVTFVPSNVFEKSCLAAFALIIVTFSASATAWVMVAVTVAFLLVYRKHAVFAAGTRCMILGSAISLLPLVTGRWDVYASLSGRISNFIVSVSADMGTSWFTLLVGKGLGIGSNSVKQFEMVFGGLIEPNYSSRIFVDSTATAIYHQLGLIGCVLFYGLLAKAAWQSILTRLIYVNLIIASVSVNILEFFPINLFMGLILAHHFSELDSRNEALL